MWNLTVDVCVVCLCVCVYIYMYYVFKKSSSWLYCIIFILLSIVVSDSLSQSSWGIVFLAIFDFISFKYLHVFSFTYVCLCVNALCKQLCTHMESIICPPLLCSALILWGRISLWAWNLCFGRLGWKSANPLSPSPSEMDYRFAQNNTLLILRLLDPNSSPHAWAASSFNGWATFPAPLHFFWLKVFHIWFLFNLLIYTCYISSGFLK